MPNSLERDSQSSIYVLVKEAWVSDSLVAYTPMGWLTDGVAVLKSVQKLLAEQHPGVEILERNEGNELRVWCDTGEHRNVYSIRVVQCLI